MKKIIFLMLCIGMMMVGCENNNITNNKTTSENSGKDLNVVCRDGTVVLGLSSWHTFFKNSQNGIEGKITITNEYTDDGIPMNVEVFVSDVSYDGKVYKINTKSSEGYKSNLDGTTEKVTLSENEKESSSKTYKYLVKLSGKPSEYTDYSETGYYLVNDNTVTYEQLKWSMLSSQSTDHIDFTTLLTMKDETNFKENLYE